MCCTFCQLFWLLWSRLQLIEFQPETQICDSSTTIPLLQRSVALWRRLFCFARLLLPLLPLLATAASPAVFTHKSLHSELLGPRRRSPLQWRTNLTNATCFTSGRENFPNEPLRRRPA